MKWTVFYVSESTGITAETLGHSLLSQFEGRIEFETVYMPYINTVRRAQQLAAQFDAIAQRDGRRPIVIATMAEPKVDAVLRVANCLYIELFDHFVGKLAVELGIAPSGRIGASHGIVDGDHYERRISIINYAMANDDGARIDRYDDADVVLVGVSRSGKTPTCLYLAIHFGLRAANYPLTGDDFDLGKIPEHLLRHRQKLVGLTINPDRLHRIREERRSGSDYAALETCRREVKMAERMFRNLAIRSFDTTNNSIEEIAALIKKRL